MLLEQQRAPAIEFQFLHRFIMIMCVWGCVCVCAMFSQRHTHGVDGTHIQWAERAAAWAALLNFISMQIAIERASHFAWRRRLAFVQTVINITYGCTNYTIQADTTRAPMLGKVGLVSFFIDGVNICANCAGVPLRRSGRVTEQLGQRSGTCIFHPVDDGNSFKSTAKLHKMRVECNWIY